MIIKYLMPVFGADPEFFFSKEGKIIGAEKVIPKEGIVEIHTALVQNGFEVTEEKKERTLIIIDGVQAELNIPPSACRQTFSRGISTCFEKLKEHIKDGVTADFSQTVEITKDEMETLSKEAQQFGCAPSINAHKPAGITIKDASKFYKRSAGGHLHFGDNNSDTLKEVFKDHQNTVRVLDILVGNTCVLLDRDEGNIERRKIYGRAGEYRLPPHGLEYRTLSNFWLKSYQLTSFVLALGRYALCVAADKEASKQLLKLVDLDKIQEAINTNNFDLAYENFNNIKDFIVSTTFEYKEHPLEGALMQAFENLVKNGIDTFFSADPFQYWLTNPRETEWGWEGFAEIKLINQAAPVN